MERTFKYKLKLFIAGLLPRSRSAIANLQRICSGPLGSQVDLEIVDVYQKPDAASRYDITAVPTLLKLEPPPMKRIHGQLSDYDRTLTNLGIEESKRRLFGRGSGDTPT